MRTKLLFSLFALFCTVALVAQVNTGTISGVVRDPQNAVVPGAKVTATNVGTQAQRSATTNSQGAYGINGLPPGNYQVTVTSGNFAPYQKSVQVSVGGHPTVDAVLSVTAAATTVEVTGETAGVEVNTQTQELSQIITPQQVQQMPSLTRNPYDFVALSGNISGGDRGMAIGNGQLSGAGQNGTDRGVGFNLNGQRASGTEVLLDGAENINLFDTTIGLLVPQDAMQEFRVITNNFDAQYGRASGGVVNVTTKSGSNNLHGSLWEYNRLSAYTANTYANVANGVDKGKYTRNQFGAAVGGPVIKDKLFFFASAEWLRVRGLAPLEAVVPDPSILTPSSPLAPNVKNIFNTLGFANGKMPTVVSTTTVGDLSPNAGGPFATAFTNPNQPIFDTVQYFANGDNGGDAPQNTYEVLGRADYNLSDKTQMFFRWGRENLDAFPGETIFASPYPQYNVGETITNDGYLYSLTHSFTPALLSSTKLSYDRDFEAQAFNASLQSSPTLFLSNGATIGGIPVQFPGFYDEFTGTGGLPYGGPQNVFQPTEDLAWTKGSHTFRFGGQFNYIQINRAYAAYGQAVEQLGKNEAGGLDSLVTGLLNNYQVAINPQGHFSCDISPTNPNAAGIPSLGVPSGLIGTSSCTVPLPTGPPSFSRSYRYRDWALYLQDSWKATPGFTFNYGMRYEYFGVQHNSNQNLDSNFYYGPGSNFAQQVNTGSIELATQSPIGKLWNPNYGTAAPRVGFAWDVLGNGTTSLRGGYGISYERNFGNVTFNMIQNLPNYATPAIRFNVPASTNNFVGVSGGGGATSILLPPVSPRQVDQNIDTAQTQFWNLSLQRQLGKQALVELSYNGAHGVHLYDIANLNMLGGGQVYLGQPVVVNPVACSIYPGDICFTRPNQAFTNINNRGSDGYSHYNGINVRVQTQDLHGTGISLLTNYTYSHSTDNISSTFSESSGASNGVGNLGFLDPRNPSLDYGNSDFDVRQRWVVSAIWTEPFLKNSKGFLRQVAGGYSLTPIFTVRSGVPFTVADSTNSLNLGDGGIPRYVPSTAIPSQATGSGTAIGPNLFSLLTLPAANSFGNPALGGISDFGPFPSNMTGRNSFRGPGAWFFDLAMAKTFRVREGINLEFNAQAFNLFNHHNMYVNGFFADAANFSGGPITIEGLKGGLGSAANNGEHDERRFGQFGLRLLF